MAGALANMGGCAPSPNVEPPLIKCSSVNEAFLRCFLTDDKVLKHLTEKMTAVAALTRIRVVVDHTMPTPLQRSTKL